MNFSGTIASDFMKLAEIPVTKRPSLINFAATDFISLRDSLITYAKAVYPRDYKYFVESDLGMMLLELVAYMGAVMSMKADMLANENFLATANQRSSVKKLLELIGIRLKGPLSAAADAKLTSDTAVPAGRSFLVAVGNRIVETASPEDGGALTFTLYKVVNGLVDTVNSTGELSFAYAEAVDADKTIFTNAVLQEGALVRDTGEFAATEGVKTIKLTKAPVVEGSVQVFTEGPDSTKNGAFVEVPNIYFASGSSDKIFEVIYDDVFNATVIFGDGSVGVSPDDTSNYVVFYRVGGGTRGNIAKDSINNSISGRISGDGGGATAAITNISKGSGGSNAETTDHAKRYAPLNFRRQDRLVTLEDYSVFSNTFISTFGTVGKATAAVRKAYSSANVIDIYVLEKASDVQLQRATTNFKTQLLDGINKKKMATDDIVIVDGLIRTLDLVTTIRIDREEEENQDQIKAKVRNKILTHMFVDNRVFGEDFNVADMNRQIFEVEEVRYSTIDNIAQNITIDFNEIVQLNNLTINIELLD
jgi:hypothetical protein